MMMMMMKYIFIILLCTFRIMHIDAKMKFRILVMLPYQTQSGFKFAFGAELSGAAVQLAIKDLDQDCVLPDITLQPEYRNSYCNVIKGLGTAADMLYKKKFSALIGPQCSQACSHVGRLASYLNIAEFTGVCQDTEMLDKNQFKTLTRFLGSFTMVGEAVVGFISSMNWTRFSVVSEMHVDKIWIFSKIGIEDVAKRQKMYIPSSLVFHDKLESFNKDMELSDIIHQISIISRIIVLAVRGDTFRKIMLLANKMKMLNGYFVFIVLFYYRQESVFGDFSWFKADEDDDVARKAYRHVFFISYYTRESPEYDRFMMRMKNESLRLFNHTYSSTDAVPYPAANLYEAMYMYGMALNETLELNEDIHNGTKISQRLWNRSFHSITGHLRLNSNGDREQGYSFSQVSFIHGHHREQENFSLIEIGTYFTDVGTFVKHRKNEIIWYLGQTPSDTPPCGYDNEFCKPISLETILLIVIATIVGFVLIGSLLAFVLFTYYKRVMKKKHAEDVWRIFHEDIIFGHKLPTSHSKLSVFSGNEALYTRTGYFKGAMVALKSFEYVDIHLALSHQDEYYDMCHLNHANVVKVIGICIDTPNFLILSDYCTKGSLQDLLENYSINLDMEFKLSLISDMIEGLLYLQDSSINYHGNLKSSNCIIDGRFTLKLTDFGPKAWLQTQNYFAKDMLWQAPELLRQPFLSLNWKSIDVYALGIIMHEIIERHGVFFKVNIELDPEDIISSVKEGRSPHFRPDISSATPPILMELMCDCWKEQMSQRPTMKVVRDRMKNVTGHGKENFVDNLLKRMEQYSNNLEALVEERTSKYLQEKKRAEGLLYSILPRTIADQLQLQGFVIPESYSSVTLLFTDIKGFTDISALSTPMEIVTMLNELYSIFDVTIDKYDAYKVETIGDAYMVVSGLPQRNENHASQIADLSLDLMKKVVSFRIPHRADDQLLLRAGIHSGPCVAGVVGLKMPRYCLFGDTVNTASRMESNGEALKIHISESTRNHLIYSTKQYPMLRRGTIPVKGKGDMTTYWLQTNSD